ncbi:MAG: hypothetical protein QOE92_1017 [Chloroflexota bacterium]|jgi:antitoxin (DNA-binding transcriptional repressor) of toxin-antitoxin stability system|nr:hypothetical protein [Chloroflexota bacterium]
MSDLENVSVVEFKRNFRAYVEEVLRGRRVRVVRHGRAVGDFVPAATVATLPVAGRPGGLLALAGLFEDWDSIDPDIAAIVASRRRAGQRPAPHLG